MIKIIKKNIKFYIFILIWTISFNSIKYNFKEGSNNMFIAYVILWGIALLYVVYNSIKYVKSQKK